MFEEPAASVGHSNVRSRSTILVVMIELLSRIHLDYSGQTIGLVSEGLGQVFEHGKDEPLQLSDIIPKEAVYDKMRPPKVEGKKTV